MTPTRPSHTPEFIGAQRVVLGTVEAIFAGLPNHAILLTARRRRFQWLTDRSMAGIITGEKGNTPV